MKRILFTALIASISLISVQSRQAPGRVFWKGMVDAKVQLLIKGDKIETKTMDGRAYPDGTYSFTSPLPDSPVIVRVNKTEGRGYVAVTQQPTADNDYKAVIEITDPKGGAKQYQLEIFWD